MYVTGDLTMTVCCHDDLLLITPIIADSRTGTRSLFRLFVHVLTKTQSNDIF